VRSATSGWGGGPSRSLLWGRVPKKSGEFFGSDTVAERYELIQMEKRNYLITMMCQALKVALWSYYEWLERIGVVTATAARRADLIEAVSAVFAEFDETYGCRWIAFVLKQRGMTCSIGLVSLIMGEQDLVAVQPRAFKVTTVAGEAVYMPLDLIARTFTARAHRW
jgi:putative transposase